MGLWTEPPGFFRVRDAVVSCAQDVGRTKQRTVVWLGRLDLV